MKVQGSKVQEKGTWTVLDAETPGKEADCAEDTLPVLIGIA